MGITMPFSSVIRLSSEEIREFSIQAKFNERAFKLKKIDPSIKLEEIDNLHLSHYEYLINLGLTYKESKKILNKFLFPEISFLMLLSFKVMKHIANS